jgi:hypothetical protein
MQKTFCRHNVRLVNSALTGFGVARRSARIARFSPQFAPQNYTLEMLILLVFMQERDRGVEPLSQPWEGWARPIYQSRNTRDFNTPLPDGKPFSELHKMSEV